ncbi:PilZ domain-containing protein [Reinekea marina]|uniref:PilZ domain-containing protein n=2 Tax=Reinekea marina TaxID=1310421 RepID=A0ABV7WUT7_9GAMM|nr:PilZ domain-containing protein [Reinekea forsetii]
MSLIDKDYEEKRDFIRMTMNATATLTEADGTSLAVKVVDLSATGMHLESNKAIAVSSSVVVIVESPNAQFQSMEAQCDVVRCIELSETKFDIGLEVKSIS